MPSKRFRTRTLAERRKALHRGEQRRTFSFNPRATDSRSVAIRSAALAGDTEALVNLIGHVVVYEAPYEVVDQFGPFIETMKTGAATASIAAGADVRFMYDHDSLVMARTASGTLEVSEDEVGVAFSASVDTRQQLANDLVIAINRGDVTQCSVGFVCIADVWSADGMSRDIYAIELVDISAVGIPCSETTDIAVAPRSYPIDEARSKVAEIQTRIGKVLSQANADRLTEGKAALDAVHEADDTSLADLGQWVQEAIEWANSLGDTVEWLQDIDAALDEAQQAFADVLGTADPDDDSEGIEEGDDEPEDEDAEGEEADVGDDDESDEDEEEERNRQVQLLELARARMRVAA